MGWVVLDFEFGLSPFFLTRSDLGWVRVPKENDLVNPAQSENIKKKKEIKAQRPKVKAQSIVCLVSYQSPSPNPNLTLNNPIITSVEKEISLSFSAIHSFAIHFIHPFLCNLFYSSILFSAIISSPLQFISIHYNSFQSIHL